MDERTVRPLTKSDLPAMLHLCQSNPQYYAHMGQRLTLEAGKPGCITGFGNGISH